MKANPRSALNQRREKRNALNVVPMEMGEKNVDLFRLRILRHDSFAEFTDAGARINNDSVARG
jgi:hypothetical protein